MSANSFGNLLQFTSFGESHGPAMGVVIDNFPAGVKISLEELKKDLSRRRPGQNELVSSRNEADEPEILSGVYEGLSLGSPICVIVANKDQRSEDYEKIKKEPRIGHADDTWKEKFGHVDPRGGGRSSGRETLSRVIAGYFAKKMIKAVHPDIRVFCYTSEVYNLKTTPQENLEKLAKLSQEKGDSLIDSHSARFLNDQHEAVATLLKEAKEEGQSYGGKAQVLIYDLPKGLGQPVFHKLKADFTGAFLSIGATNGLNIGFDNDTTKIRGDDFHSSGQNPRYGGIRGGISTGETIPIEVGFKPTSSIKDIAKQGRHDPCIIPRACPVLQAMAYFVLADHILWHQTDRLEQINN